MPKLEKFTTLAVVKDLIQESGTASSVIDDLLDRLPKILGSASQGMMGHSRPVITISHDSLWRVLEAVQQSYADQNQPEKAQTIVRLKEYLHSRL